MCLRLLKDENWVWTLGMECHNFQEERTYTLSTGLQFLSSHTFHKTWVKDDRCYGLLQNDCNETVLMTWDLAAEIVLSSVALQITGTDLHFNLCSLSMWTQATSSSMGRVNFWRLVLIIRILVIFLFQKYLSWMGKKAGIIDRKKCPKDKFSF